MLGGVGMGHPKKYDESRTLHLPYDSAVDTNLGRTHPLDHRPHATHRSGSRSKAAWALDSVSVEAFFVSLLALTAAVVAWFAGRAVYLLYRHQP